VTARRPAGAGAGANRVRIIGGTHRSRLLKFPERPGLRPTPDRVRETLFNWLGQELAGLACLDLYAGSGALGLEAASRGASSIVLVDSDRDVVTALRANVDLLRIANAQVVQGDALEFLRRDRRVFDVVFVDPPFADADHAAVLARVADRLAPGARVYVEAPRALEAPDGWSVQRRLVAGSVHAHLMQPDR
jgi:16S rRNA (guanine966-N2)-methyltransferase